MISLAGSRGEGIPDSWTPYMIAASLLVAVVLVAVRLKHGKLRDRDDEPDDE